MSVAKELLALRNRAWITSGARYNAARRLRTRSRLSLATIALVSALGIAAPLLLASESFVGSRENLSLYSSILSIFILVVAIIEGAASYEAKADTLFRSAELLNAFRLRVNVLLIDESSQSVEELGKLTSEYERIKSECAINHEVVDFNLVRAAHPGDFELPENWIRKPLARIVYFLYSTWWLSLISIAAVLGLGLVVHSGAEVTPPSPSVSAPALRGS